MGLGAERTSEPKTTVPPFVAQTMTSATKLPLSQFGTTKKPHVIGLDHNCLSHSNTQNNEETVKAFKMACLNYKPSPVQFEKALYSKNELIDAKNNLMYYCLNQLKHLDLGSVEQKMFAARINLDPRHVPSLPDYRISDNTDSVESLVKQKPHKGLLVPKLFLKTTEASVNDSFNSARQTQGPYVNFKNQESTLSPTIDQSFENDRHSYLNPIKQSKYLERAFNSQGSPLGGGQQKIRRHQKSID